MTLRIRGGLPDTLSGLLRVAVAECLEVEAGGKHVFDMGTYCQRQNGHCVMCMAGAIMASRTVGFSQLGGEHLLPHNYDDGTAQKFRAINALRTGDVTEAGENMGFALTADQRAVAGCIEDLMYEYDPIDEDESGGWRAPWPIYLEVADMLEEAGL